MFLMSVLVLGCQLPLHLLLLAAPPSPPSSEATQPLPDPPTPPAMREAVGGRPLRRLIGGGPSFSRRVGRLPPRWDMLVVVVLVYAAAAVVVVPVQQARLARPSTISIVLLLLSHGTESVSHCH